MRHLAVYMLEVCDINFLPSKLIESKLGFGPRQGNLRLFLKLFSLMRGLPSIILKQPENEPEI